jgi:hypothetical protein
MPAYVETMAREIRVSWDMIKEREHTIAVLTGTASADADSKQQ